MERNLRKERVGTVTSNKMDKTATVLIARLVEHPVYHRVVRRSKKFLVHDENNECQEPENLKGKPKDCSPEQICECHGTVEDHPCTGQKE